MFSHALEVLIVCTISTVWMQKIRDLLFFIVGFDVGCVSEARMDMAATMEQKISNGIQLLRCPISHVMASYIHEQPLIP